MNIFSILLISFLVTGSIGFMHDPLFDGISVKFGQNQGLRTNFLINFKSGETQVDSAKYKYDSYVSTIYRYSFYRPYFTINYGLRFHYYFMDHNWYQTYLGVGLEGKSDKRWENYYTYYEIDSTYEIHPVQHKTNYWGPTLSGGVDFFPIAFFTKLLNIDTHISKALSFNIEICSFYLIKHEFSDGYLQNNWIEIGYYPERTFSGIGMGLGVQYNW